MNGQPLKGCQENTAITLKTKQMSTDQFVAVCLATKKTHINFINLGKTLAASFNMIIGNNVLKLSLPLFSYIP